MISRDSGGTESQNKSNEKDVGAYRIQKRVGDSEPQRSFPKKGLWAALPIPAFQVLARTENWVAQRVLLALVLHMGKDSNCVWPSYTTIQRSTGLGRTSISKGLTVLCEFNFIKIARFREGKKSRSKYYLQPGCWDTSYMSETAIPFRHKTAVCIECGELLDDGGYGMGRLGAVHWGCGGKVIKAKRDNPRGIKG
jgi:hypothetical protein